MAEKNRLSEEMISNPLKDGYYGDGGLLYLKVSNHGKTRTWCFRYDSALTGKRREYSIGNLKCFSLEDARRRAEKLRKQLAFGIDPAELRKRKPNERPSDEPPTFEEVARKFIEIKRGEWKNEKEEKRWLNLLEIYVFPFIGSLPVNEVDTDEILLVLKPIWLEITVTAVRLRGLLERIFRYAKALKVFTGTNPASWDVLEWLLANPTPILARKKKHFYALPHKEIPGLMRALCKGSGLSYLMIRLLILTACRSVEVREADWAEINFKEKLWTIPKNRMKAGREHIIPLCDEAISILKLMQKTPHGKGLVFPNQKGKAFSDVALSKTLKIAAENPKATIHGLRSTFADWAYENKAASYQAIQSALAHSFKSASDAAYFRSDLLEERRRLMEAWEKFCLGELVKA